MAIGIEENPTIETSRLLLRQMHENDLEDFLEYFTDPYVNRFLGGAMPIDRNGASIIFRSNCITKYTWAIELKSEGKVIGDVHFGNIIGAYLAHIGYIINRSYWGNGYALEAVGTIVEYGFRELDFWRIRAITQLFNMRSQKLLEKCGFEKEALIYDGDFNGKIDDIYYYSRKKYSLFQLSEVIDNA